MSQAPPRSLQIPRRGSLLRGIRLGFPIFLGYVPVGMAFGILATTAGFAPIQAVACSATALAGAGQFIALAVMKTGGAVLAVIAATTIVNLRYVLFGATVSPYLTETPLLGQAALAFSLTDETFAVNISDLHSGAADEFSMAGVGAISWVGWVVGTAVGAYAASLVGDPSRFGVDFAMPAMFTALLVGQVESRKHLVVAAIAGVLAVALASVLPDKWYLVVASIVAATIAAVVYR